jgi:hypothetical protein
VIERYGQHKGNVWDIETNVTRYVTKWEPWNRQWIAFDNPDAVKIQRGNKGPTVL